MEALLVFVLAFLSSTAAQSQNTVYDNGTVTFARVPTSTGSFTPLRYDARGLDGFYAMANGFADVVRSGSLPYDELIIPQLQAFYPTIQNPNSGRTYNPDVNELVQTFLRWYAGVIAVTILGFVLAFCMPVVCVIVCCCRLCNFCGGNLNSSIDDEEKEKKRRVCCIILFVFVLIFLALVTVGMVFSFLTNEAIQTTVDTAVPTVFNAVDDIAAFASATLDEAAFLVVDQLNFTTNLVVNEVTDLNSSVVQPLIEMNRPAIDSLLNGILTINDSLSAVGSALDDVSTNISALNVTAMSISAQVVILRAQLTNLTTDCMAEAVLSGAGACDDIPDPDSIQDVDVTSQLNNVQMTIDSFRSTLSISQNLTDIVNMINDTINNIPSLVQDAVGNQTGTLSEGVAPALTNVSQGLDSARTAIDNIFTYSNSSVRTFRTQFIDAILFNNDVPYSLSRLSLARYIVGVLFCVVALLVIVCVALGLTCGVAGFNKDRLPFERTSLSNCGGVCLLASAALIFFAGFILFILAAFMFPFGTTLRKVCLAIQDPEYEVFGPRLLGNTAIWGDPALGSMIQQFTGDSQFGQLNVDVPAVFRGCDNNQPLYSALQGDTVLNSINISIVQGMPPVNLGELTRNPLQILDIFNVSIDQLTGQLNDQLANFNLSNVIPTSTIDSLLASLPNVSAIDTTSQINSLNTLIVDANTSLVAAEGNVTILRANASTANATNVVNQADAILNTINTTQSLLNTVAMQVMDLDNSAVRAQMEAEAAVNASKLQINASLAEANNLLTAFNSSLFMVVNGLVNSTTGYVTQYVDYVLDALRTDAIRCGPLSNAYIGPLNLVCRQTVNSMNGFWFSIGWCAIFFIPLVAFVIALSKHFRRHKDVDEILRNPEYDGGYMMETYYNPSAANTVNGNNHAPNGTEGTYKKGTFDDSYPLFEDPRSGVGNGQDYWIENQNVQEM
jgi:hypothetical protein